MKKYLVILVLALYGAVQSNAQITWNVRAGCGTSSSVWDDAYWWNKDSGTPTTTNAYMVSLETNIPFAKGSQWCISPSIIVACDSESGEFSLPILIGYKIPVGGGRCIYIPKVGPFVGYRDDDDPIIFGPSVEWATEGKHIIMAMNASLDVVGEIGTHVFFSIGYKF